MSATVRKVKITSAQIIALRSAEMQDDGSYILPTAKAQTLAALARIGVVTGPRSLTVQGVSVMHTVSHVDVIASKGHTVYLSDAPESLEMFTLGDESKGDENGAQTDAQSVSEGVVTVQGEYVEPTTMVDLDGNVIPYDAFGSMAIQEARARIENGGCVGLCAIGTGCAHCDEQYGPEASQTDAESVSEFVTFPTVNVVQAWAGSNGMNHYHAPGCRDIEREGKRWGIRAEHGNMGRYEFSFSSVADIIEHEYSDCNEGDAHAMVSHANDDFDGLKIMSCLRDSLPLGAIQGMPVEFKGGRWTLGNAPLDSERCTVCEVYGNVADNSTDIDGKHVCGYCVDNGRTVETMESHSLTFYVETEGKGKVYECAYCGSIDTRANFATSGCEGDYRPDDDSDAGFVETESMNDYAIVSRLTTGAGFHTVTEDDKDAGFVETMITKDYELSVIVDDSTGATVYLGWVTLEMNAAQCMDFDRVAEEYGRTHGTGKPRHGWASIITVHNVADI